MNKGASIALASFCYGAHIDGKGGRSDDLIRMARHRPFSSNHHCSRFYLVLQRSHPQKTRFRLAATKEMTGASIALASFYGGKGAPLCRSTRTLAAAIMATVLAAIHPAIIPAIIPANVPAAWVSIRSVMLRAVRLIEGAHITVIGRITISRSVGAVTPARIIAGPATAAARTRIRFIRLHTQCCQNKRGCESNITQLH